MFAAVGTAELVIVAFILLFLFLGKKIPELLIGFIEAFREFRRNISKIK